MQTARSVAVGGDDRDRSQAEAHAANVLRTHGLTLVRVCVALLGDEPAERDSSMEGLAVQSTSALAIEVAEEVARTFGRSIADARTPRRGDAADVDLEASERGAGQQIGWVELLALARVACANRLSKASGRTNGRFMELPRADTIDGSRRGTDEVVSTRRALTKIRPTEREALVLHLVGGLSVAEVAAACGVAEAEARARISRGLAAMVSDTSAASGAVFTKESR